MKTIIVLAIILMGAVTGWAQIPDGEGAYISSYNKSMAPLDRPEDGTYKKHLFNERKPLPYDHIREADVFWKKRIWREIDVKQKMNLAFANPQQPLVEIFRQAGIEGAITLYSGEDDAFTKPLTPGDISNIGLEGGDSVEVINPATGLKEMVYSPPVFDAAKVTRFRIKEDWIFDEATSTMQVRIIGIAPVVEVWDDQGNFRGMQVMFWAHYPECRALLAQYPYYNTQNDISYLSWENVLEMRYFDSYIIKESNVYDRRIQDYAQGEDALIEGERIAQELYEFEDDLWSH